MILPAFGNAVNDMWDIVYGKGVSEDGDIIYNNIQDRELNRLTFTDWEDGISNQDTPRMRLIEAVVPDVNITHSLSDAFIKDAAAVRAAS